MRNLFRYVVAISTILFVVLWILPYFHYLWLTEEELNLAAAQGYGSYIPGHPLIYWGLFAAWLAVSIGLFFFVAIARTAFVFLLVATAVANFFWGFWVMPPFSAGISGLVAVADGAIVTMIYLTSVSNHFVKRT